LNIYNKSSLINFWKKHPDCKNQLELWFDDVSGKRWKKPNDVKKDYATASIIQNSRVVFNIKGNDYRLIAELNYNKGWCFIKFIGTHAEYDKIEAKSVNLF
jgi:mRNA interferase HigB